MKRELKNMTNKYILSEIQKIKYTYGLNKVIRYNLERKEKYQTQSVAEHITNMIFLAHYFRDLEDPKKKLDFEKVIKIIIMHDLGEIETGDIVTLVKNKSDENIERKAIKQVKKKSPDFISKEIESIYKEFENPKTKEGMYANAIDKLEGQFFWIEREGVTMRNEVTRKLGLDIDASHAKQNLKINTMLDKYNFPIIKKFLEVINAEKNKYGILRIDL